jgi:hypothetical protein
MEEQQSRLPSAQDGEPAGDGAEADRKVQSSGDPAGDGADAGWMTQSNGDGADDYDYGWYDFDDWTWDTWGDYRVKVANERLRFVRQNRDIGLGFLHEVRLSAHVQYLFQTSVSILLLIGGAWALAGVVQMLLDGSFVRDATARLGGFTIADVADGILVTTLLAPPLLLALLGFVLIGLALRVIRHRVLQNSLMGVSQVQHELAAGTGETRPLVQVVQETINNARQTFTTILRLSQASFWVGLFFLAVTLYRAVWRDQIDLLTLGTGAMGVAGWLVSFAVSQKEDIQANLADVTQLELGLVALAKQVSYVDLCLSNAQNEPDLTATRDIAEWGMQEIERSAFAIAGLVELYAQSAGRDEDHAQHRRLLHQAVRMHTHLDSARASELRDLAGEYASVLMERAGLLTPEDLLDAAAMPEGRKKLVDQTGIHLELILEFAKLADLMRVGSVGYPTACLLRDAGIGSAQHLAGQDPAALCQKLELRHTKQNRMSRPPTEKQVVDWVKQASALEPKLDLKESESAPDPKATPA